jgi:hypothetical protein
MVNGIIKTSKKVMKGNKKLRKMNNEDINKI